jgi:hypothetical protein
MLNYSNQSPEQKPHFNVVITTPGNKMCAEYVKCLLATIQFFQENNISWFYQNEYASLITNAREATITGNRFLEASNPYPGKGIYTYDKIFCIDSDIVWEVDSLIKLYLSDKDVISGIYYEAQGADAMVVRKKGGYSLMKREEVNDLRQKQELISVHGIGLGFVCLKSGVFESIKRPWFDLGIVKYEDNGVVYDIPLGEDLNFCEKILESGYKIYVDPTVIVGHVKSNIVI